jgi:hypothetical protein
MIWRGVLLVAAALALLVPLPATLVDRVYARLVFPALQPVLTTLSNLVPFALFDVLLIGAVGWFVIGTLRSALASGPAGRRGWLLRAVGRLATMAATAYLVFLFTWGLNYRRPPLSSRLDFDPTRASSDAALDLAYETVHRVNGLYESARRESWPKTSAVDPELSIAFARAQRELGSLARFVPGRPKRTLLDGYLRRAGVAGMTDPYFLETLMATDLLPIERPLVVAHEWSHLAGIADEGDANFAGWLTCLRGSAFHQYSGWLFLYGEVAGALAPPDARRVAANLSDGPRADLSAIRNRLLQHVSPALAGAGWRVYDQYLKANRVERGTDSYADVVRLVLGTDFGSDWTPRLR